MPSLRVSNSSRRRVDEATMSSVLLEELRVRIAVHEDKTNLKSGEFQLFNRVLRISIR